MKQIMIILGLLIVLCSFASAVTKTYYEMDVSFDYFNMSDSCNGEIGFAPNSSYPLEVCLNNGTTNIYCQNYTTGEYNKSSTFIFNNVTLEQNNNYRLFFNWSRIRYIDMNNSALDGEYDHEETANNNKYYSCLSHASLDTSYCSVNLYSRLYVDRNDGVGDCYASNPTTVSPGTPVFTNAGCTGNPINLRPGTGNSGYVATNPTSTRRIYEGYIRTGGSNASITGCALIQKMITTPCSTCINWGVADYSATGCTNGAEDNYPTSLCDYVADYDTNSTYFNITTSKTYAFNSSTYFTSGGNVTLITTKLNINIYDETTGSPIYENISITIYNDDYYNSTFWTNTSYLNISTLENGSYTVLFTSPLYVSSSYPVTLSPSSTTTLDAYLMNSSSSTIFTMVNSETGQPVEDVTVTIMRYVNDVLTTVNVLSSDVSGRVQFNYYPDILYSFQLSKSNYEDKVFTLNPIIFSTYTVQMIPTKAVSDSSDYTGLNMYITPQIYYAGDNMFYLIITQPDGLLSNYGYTITYPGGSNSSIGFNAYGETMSLNFSIVGATFGDTVNVTPYYKLSGESTKTYNFIYDIIPTPGNHTFMDNKGQHHGMGIFERVSISTIIAITTGGMATIFLGAEIGLAFGVMILGYMVYIGFIPYWLLAIPVLGAFIYIVWRGSL